MRIRHGARLAPAGRQAFTVIELLVVISIIAVLAALTTAAVMRFRVTALGFSTRTGMTKIQGALLTQYKAVSDAAKTESMTTTANAPFLAQALTKGLGPQDGRVKAEFARLKVVQAFPTNFGEVFAPGGNAALALPAYVQQLQKQGITSANYTSIPADVQSAVCLLMIVEVGPKSGALTGDDLGASTVGDLAAGTLRLRGIVDGWRKPVVLTRQDPVPEKAGQPGSAVSAKFTLTSGGNDGNLSTPTDNIVVTNP